MNRNLAHIGLALTIILLATGAAFGAVGEELFQIQQGFKLTPAIIMVVCLGVYIGVGFLSKVSSSSGYWVAGRGIGKIGNGAAIASDWMSAASFMGFAGLLYLKGWFALSYIIGGMGGYVLLLCLVAAQIRRFGKYTIPEFLGDRYDSHAIRLFGAGVTVIIAITYAVAQFKGIGLVSGWIFGMSYSASVFFGAGVVLSYMLLSGMAGVTRNQQIQYVVLISAFLVPLWVLMKKAGGHGVLPPIEYGKLIADVMEGKVAAGNLSITEAAAARRAYMPWGAGDIYHFIAVAFTFMAGTAGMPHVLIRFYTVKDEHVARRSVIWGLFFIGLLYWCSPAYAALGKFWNPLGGKPVADVIILSAPEKAGLGISFIGYLAAGALAASLSTVAGLLVAGASAVAHDWYSTVFRPNSNDKQILLVGRLFTAVLCVIVVVLALKPPALIAQVAAMVFSTAVLCVIVVILALKPPSLIAQVAAMFFAIAANTLTPGIVLGIWYSKANKYGTLAGMSFGLAGTLICIVGWVAKVPLFSSSGLLPATSSALLLCPAAFLINILVSNLMAEKLSRETLDRTDAIMRKLHNLPGVVDDEPLRVSVLTH